MKRMICLFIFFFLTFIAFAEESDSFWEYYYRTDYCIINLIDKSYDFDKFNLLVFPINNNDSLLMPMNTDNDINQEAKIKIIVGRVLMICGWLGIFIMAGFNILYQGEYTTGVYVFCIGLDVLFLGVGTVGLVYYFKGKKLLKK